MLCPLIEKCPEYKTKRKYSLQGRFTYSHKPKWVKCPKYLEFYRQAGKPSVKQLVAQLREQGYSDGAIREILKLYNPHAPRYRTTVKRK